jgi:diguanylate cyclase (GGDEF)-like protein
MVKTTITFDKNGEELEFIRFLNGLLPQKPDPSKTPRVAVERTSSLVPFDLLILCVESDQGIQMVLFPRAGLPESYVTAAKESIFKGKSIIFPTWKDREIEENVIEYSPAAESGLSGSPANFLSVLQHKIDAVPNGLVQIFSGRKDAFDEKHEFILGVLTYWLVSYYALARIYERLEALAVTDPLTGVFNRRKFEMEIDREIERSRRYNLNFSLLMMDVDNLKSINDTYGHYYGDMMLQKCAKVLSGNVRKVDTVTRIGGDEFVVILPHTRAEGAKIVAERLLEILKCRQLDLNGTVIGTSCTLSVACFHPDDTMDTLYKRVDTGLNEAKKTCKGGYFIVE